LFVADDLSFGTDIDRDALGRIEARALSQLEREDRRSAAARILNDALDDAKQRLLRLDPTVSELFDMVRQELLKEGRELVLLVEDFAVLSGLQKQLLQVIIKEAFRDGRQVLCTMRTALAYTTGYLSKDTVLTRANVEYRIPDEPGNEDEILLRIERLVGAYLNAARVGEDTLERAYAASDTTSEALHGWVPAFSSDVESEVRSTLDAFGTSLDGYELFPFNGAAVRELSHEGSIQAGRLVYNPRFVIQNVLNKVLGHRDLFEAGNFPPALFGVHGRPVPARVAEAVRKRVPVSAFERYLRFLAYWGGFPGTATEINQIERRVYLAFGLEPLTLGKDSTGDRPGSSASSPTKTQPTSPPQSEGAHHVDPLETKWESVLEGWRSGVSISQTDANQLRKWIAEALRGFVEWDWNLYRPRKDADLDSWFNWIYIPRASGNEGRTAEEAMVAVLSDADLADQAKSATVQSALMAIIRFHGVQKGSWDYLGAEDDLPKYGALLELLARRAQDFAQRRYFRADWDPLPALVEGLLIGARALGIDGAAKDRHHASLISSMFSVASDVSAIDPGKDLDPELTQWLEFTAMLRRCRRTSDKESRDQLSWQGHLLNLIAARQGQADNVHAIDVFRLKSAIEKTVAAWEFGESLPSQSGVTDFAALRATYTDLRKLSAGVAKAQWRLSRWRGETLAWLGEGVDKDALVRDAKETIEAARTAGLTTGIDTRRTMQLLEDFRTSRVMAALEDTGRMTDSAPRGLTLTILGRGYGSLVRLSEELRLRLDELLGAVEAELASESLTYGDDPFNEAITLLSRELQDTQKQLQKVE
jgi:hypothetical protein